MSLGGSVRVIVQRTCSFALQIFAAIDVGLANNSPQVARGDTDLFARAVAETAANTAGVNAALSTQ